MDSKVTWRVEVLNAVDSKAKSTDVNAHITKVTWRIENFLNIEDQNIYSENFIVDGIKWRISIIRESHNPGFFSIWLEIADAANLPYGWSSAQFGFAIIDQIDRKSSRTRVVHEFNTKIHIFGFQFLHVSELQDPERGYLIKDACLVEVYVASDMNEDLISRDLMLQTDVSSEEVMNTFFTNLEAEILTSSIVFSQEDANEALSKVNEALNMTLINFYNSGKFDTLKHAFNILARFNGSSIPIETEQKNELLVMMERLKDLAERAAKVVQDKNNLTENQSMKLTISRNLIRYKEVDSEVKQVEQKLAALLAERNEIFKSSKEIKMELEAFGNEYPEYEAKAKVAEEEEKTIEAEWGRMKDFISSIEGKI